MQWLPAVLQVMVKLIRHNIGTSDVCKKPSFSLQVRRVHVTHLSYYDRENNIPQLRLGHKDLLVGSSYQAADGEQSWWCSGCIFWRSMQ